MIKCPVVLQAPTPSTQLNCAQTGDDNLYPSDSGDQVAYMFPFHQDFTKFPERFCVRQKMSPFPKTPYWLLPYILALKKSGENVPKLF